MFHFFLAPLLLANFIFTIVRTVQEWPSHPGLHIWSIVVAFLIFAMCGKMRQYALANQDRIIRLEERIRISTLAPGADVFRLTTSQLIALRFASDDELPVLVERTLKENLEPKVIKASIISWRPDYQRI